MPLPVRSSRMAVLLALGASLRPPRSRLKPGGSRKDGCKIDRSRRAKVQPERYVRYETLPDADCSSEIEAQSSSPAMNMSALAFASAGHSTGRDSNVFTADYRRSHAFSPTNEFTLSARS